jgi:hypothetical protein
MKGTTTYDTSGQGSDGYFVNQASSPAWERVGKVGHALRFDGNEDYVNAGSANIYDNLGPMTVSAWVKGNMTLASDEIIVGKVDAGANDGHWDLTVLCCGSYGALSFFKDGSTNLHKTSINGSVATSTWQFVAATWDGSTDANNVKLYINGAEPEYNYNTSGVSLVTDNALDVIIGNRENGDRPFGGLIDQVKIYNYVRTPAQIAWDYNRGKPIAYWRFDECSGETIYDQSGNNNHGSLYLGLGGAGGGGNATGTCASTSPDTFWGSGTAKRGAGTGSFDGEDDYVTTSNNLTVDTGEPFSVSLWTYLHDFSPEVYPLPLAIKSDQGDDAWGLFFTSDASFTDIAFGSQTSWGRYGKDQPAVLNTWLHVVITYNGSGATTISNYTMYVNGLPNVLESTSAFGNVNNVTQIASLNSDYYWDGLIDEVKIFNYALTEEQAKNEHNGGAVRFGN